MTLVRATDGTQNLHLWREGEEYLRQKGEVFLKEWNNLIFATTPGQSLANTRYIDLSTADLDFADNTFDSVYANHIFEHLSPAEGDRCVRRLYDVLRPGGACRVSVPDLEQICRDYLAALEEAARGLQQRQLTRYSWAVMAIFEQMVRDRSGGMMADAVSRGDYDDTQLRELFGDGLRPLVDRADRRTGPAEALRPSSGRSGLRQIVRRVRAILSPPPPEGADGWRSHPRFTKEAVRWMYDRVSLGQLLERAGFQEVRKVDHTSSRIPRWADYDFDRSNYGSYPLDPSVYVEGTKPR
jgi:hypothetical protein